MQAVRDWRAPRLFADPEEIGVHHQDRAVVEQFQALGKTAAGIQQRCPLVGNDDPGPASVLQMRFHLIGEMVDVDRRRLDPGAFDRIERIVDHRLAGDAHQRFRYGIGNGAQAGAEPRGEHHGILDRHRQHLIH